MAFLDGISPQIWLGIVSAVILGAVGTLTLMRGPRRVGYAFAAFLFIWSCQVLLFNLQSSATGGAKAPLLFAALFLTPLHVLSLVVFTVEFLRRRQRVPSVVLWATLAYAGLATGLLLATPSSFFQIVTEPDGSTRTILLPLTGYFSSTPFFFSFFLAASVLVALIPRLSGLARKEAVIIACALSAYAGYAAGYYGLAYLPQFGLRAAGSTLGRTLSATMTIGSIVLIAAMILATRSAQGEDSAGTRRAVRWIGLTFAITLAFGAVLAVARVWTGAAFVSAGLFRAFAALVIAYGILKHQIFDIDLKLKWTLDRGTLVAIFGGVFFVVDQVAQYFVSAAFGTLAGVAAALLLLPLLGPLRKMTSKLADRALPGVGQTAGYLRERGRIVFCAALESVAKDGSITERERDMLTTLKREFGISDDEGNALERDVLSRVRANVA